VFDGVTWSVEGSSHAYTHQSKGGAGASSAAGIVAGSTQAPYLHVGLYTATLSSTGSFDRAVVNYFTGDATKISSSLFAETGVISSSAQIASDISGSFIRGFNFGALPSDIFVGVSGSNSAHSSSISGSTRGMSMSGSDYKYLTEAGELLYAGGAGVWSSGGSTVIGVYHPEITGLQNAAIKWGGSSPVSQCNIEIYNGSSWSAGTAQPRTGVQEGTGTTNATVAFTTGSLEYNGTVWTVGPDMSVDHCGKGGSTGTQNAGIFFGGGYDTTAQCSTEHYNGTSFTTGGNMSIEEVGVHILEKLIMQR
jgi:hypothetical protein